MDLLTHFLDLSWFVIACKTILSLSYWKWWAPFSWLIFEIISSLILPKRSVFSSVYWKIIYVVSGKIFSLCRYNWVLIFWVWSWFLSCFLFDSCVVFWLLSLYFTNLGIFFILRVHFSWIDFLWKFQVDYFRFVFLILLKIQQRFSFRLTVIGLDVLNLFLEALNLVLDFKVVSQGRLLHWVRHFFGLLKQKSLFLGVEFLWCNGENQGVIMFHYFAWRLSWLCNERKGSDLHWRLSFLFNWKRH